MLYLLFGLQLRRRATIRKIFNSKLDFPCISISHSSSAFKSHMFVRLRRMLPTATSKSEEIFQFHDYFSEENSNGAILDNIFIPEEILVQILSYVDPKNILSLSLVCKKWCNIIKSDLLWSIKYTRHYHKKSKKLPWYVYYCLFTTNYFDTNLIRNGNGQEKFKYWQIVKNYGDAFQIEPEPRGSPSLPTDVPEFNGFSSCFATSYYECNKLQRISIKNCKLMLHILNEFKPHIYASEWVTGRFDCGCKYTLWCKLFGENKKQAPVLFEEHTFLQLSQWSNPPWQKVEIVLKDYPKGIKNIVFQHEGSDTQFWKGHYGSKMTGGVLKILFDSIEPKINAD